MAKNKEETIKKEIYKKIAKVVSFICKNPLIYFSEMDIHVLMMNELLKIGHFKRLHDTGVSVGKNKKGDESEKKYQTMLVHKEYGTSTGIGERSDIVIFDEKDAKQITDPIKLKKGKQYIRPQYIFEFGTEKSAGKRKYKEHLTKDIEKLRKSKERGFLIHIDRNWVRSPKESKTLIGNRNKYESYVEETYKAWNACLEKNKIVPLIFFIEIGVKARHVGSKVKMFDPYQKDQQEFLPINLNKIENEAMRILEYKE